MSTATAESRRVVPNRGVYASEAEALAEVVHRLVRHLDPAEIWLFGSRASGRHTPDSDFDLFIVTKDEDGPNGCDFDRAYAPLVGLGIGCDVVPCAMSEFARERSDPTSFCHHVANSGRRIYEREAHRSLLPAR